MGLRAKVLVVMVALLTLLATASTALVHVRATEAIREREASDAVRDMRLLLAMLNTQLVHIDGVLNSWSNWTDLYAHAVRPSAAFRAQELSAQAVAVSQVDLLAVLAPDGHPIEQVQVTSSPDPRSALLLATGAPETAQDFAALSARLPRACGLYRLGQFLGLACYRPLLDSKGIGPAHGSVLIGRRITSPMLADMAEQSRLQFRIVPRSAATPTGPAVLADMPFGAMAPTIDATAPTQLQVSVPLLDIGGRHVADLQMDWPRLALAAARKDLLQTAWLLLLLIVGMGGAAIVVVDRLVVRRLARLRDELGLIVATGNWDGQIRAAGRDEIAALAAFVNQIIGVVRKQMAELGHLASTDTLTGLGNRRRFDEQLAQALARCKRTGQRCCLVLADVDYFKRYNDLHGHPAGDRALGLVGQRLQALVRRQGDLAARVGGEEFALLLEDTGLEAALALAESACQAVRNAGLPHPHSAVASVLTLSCGVARARATDTPSSLYMRADQALYTAKEGGRNRAVQEPAEEPQRP